MEERASLVPLYPRGGYAPWTLLTGSGALVSGAFNSNVASLGHLVIVTPMRKLIKSLYWVCWARWLFAIRYSLVAFRLFELFITNVLYCSRYRVDGTLYYILYTIYYRFIACIEYILSLVYLFYTILYYHIHIYTVYNWWYLVLQYYTIYTITCIWYYSLYRVYSIACHCFTITMSFNLLRFNS